MSENETTTKKRGQHKPGCTCAFCVHKAENIAKKNEQSGAPTVAPKEPPKTQSEHPSVIGTDLKKSSPVDMAKKIKSMAPQPQLHDHKPTSDCNGATGTGWHSSLKLWLVIHNVVDHWRRWRRGARSGGMARGAKIAYGK